MSQLPFLSGSLSEVLNQDGSPKFEIILDEKAKRLITIASNESFDSHQRMFGWNKEQSLVHNTNLAITMGIVGQGVQLLKPPAILIHNESFIARGALNNLFTEKDKPIPVICLRDLLERKRRKE